MIEIQLATPADAAVIADLSRTTFYDAFISTNSKENMDKFMTEQFTRERLMAEVGAPGNTFFLALLNNEPIAYARLREAPNPAELGDVPAIELARIYASQQVIGKGAGSALMKRCLQVATEQNCRVIWLGVWEHNQPAIDFYTRWGFEKFSEHEFILGNDVQTDWLMKKVL